MFFLFCRCIFFIICSQILSQRTPSLLCPTERAQRQKKPKGSGPKSSTSAFDSYSWHHAELAPASDNEVKARELIFSSTTTATVAGRQLIADPRLSLLHSFMSSILYSCFVFSSCFLILPCMWRRTTHTQFKHAALHLAALPAPAATHNVHAAPSGKAHRQVPLSRMSALLVLRPCMGYEDDAARVSGRVM